MARGEAHGRAVVEISANVGVKWLAVRQVTRITEIVVGFENVGRPPSHWAGNEYETHDRKKPHGRSRGSASTTAIRLFSLGPVQDSALLDGPRSFA
jgi:hypothetical protein